MAPKTPMTSFQIAMLFVVAIALFVVYQKYIAPPAGQPATGSGSVIIYDTDPENDRYIKGELTGKQLSRFDRILEREKANKGQRLSGVELSELAGDDRELTEAYNRWCSCKDMMRSSSHIVYPSERNSLRKKD